MYIHIICIYENRPNVPGEQANKTKRFSNLITIVININYVTYYPFVFLINKYILHPYPYMFSTIGKHLSIIIIIATLPQNDKII